MIRFRIENFKRVLHQTSREKISEIKGQNIGQSGFTRVDYASFCVEAEGKYLDAIRQNLNLRSICPPKARQFWLQIFREIVGVDGPFDPQNFAT